jgi:hypothetical protein
VSFNEKWSARLHLNLDAEPERSLDRNRIDVIEATATYRSFLGSFVRIRVRGGIFFPPVSLENTGTAWTSPYSITGSAINSWIGEEVRITGGEAALTFLPPSQEITIFGSIFGMNDPSGTLLAWRGWSLQDRQSGYLDRLPLAPINAISAEGLFPRQPAFVEPFREVDGKAGYYAGAAWLFRNLELSGIHYDNRANPEEFDGVQYGWGTDFTNISAQIRVRNLEILSQYLTGTSEMGRSQMVHIDFSSWYILASVTHSNHRISLRFDDFEVNDRDRYKELDNNNEEGTAWMGSYRYRFSERHNLILELLRIDSDRPARADLGKDQQVTEYVFQASYRFQL